MKKMILVICSTALLLFSFSRVSAQPKYIVKAETAFANFMGDGAEYNKVLPTFRIGGQVEFGLSDALGLGVGLEVAGKGAKVEISTIKGQVNPIYLQVPVQMTFRTGGLFVGAGPFIGVGITGKAKANGEKADINFGNESNDGYRRLDYGAGLELGYEFGPLRAFASYNHGLANVVPKDNADLFDVRANSSVFGVGLAYIMGGSR